MTLEGWEEVEERCKRRRRWEDESKEPTPGRSSRIRYRIMQDSIVQFTVVEYSNRVHSTAVCSIV